MNSFCNSIVISSAVVLLNLEFTIYSCNTPMNGTVPDAILFYTTKTIFSP